MKKLLTVFSVVLITTGIFISPVVSLAQNSDNLVIHFFYSPDCPHCQAEEPFLDDMEKKYPEIEINRYRISNSDHHDLLRDLAKKHNAERFLGSVPMTFVGNNFFMGFDNRSGIGQKIENSIVRQLEERAPPEISTSTESISVPIVGEINPENYSLPALAVTLGLLDGFNVCSLGALILILGLVIALKSRKKIISLGGLFIFTTALIYGLLIVLWYQLFASLAGYIGAMKLIVALLGLGGGLFFLHEFRKYRKYGPQCETAGNKLVSRFSNKVQNAFENKQGLLALAGLIFIFAAVITIVEFPCSAAVPVVFASILAEQGLSTAGYVSLIALFTLFYMLDELIIFLIAVWKMDVWMASPKFVTWATLIEGIILIALGLYYLVGIV